MRNRLTWTLMTRPELLHAVATPVRARGHCASGGNAKALPTARDQIKENILSQQAVLESAGA